MKERYLIGIAIITTVVCGMVLSSTLPEADAETVSASIEVSPACTVSSNVTSVHTRTLSVNSYEEGIGTTKITTICNDPEGYAIYAVGFTNDTEGNTNLVGLGTNANIPTGIASGNTSNWSMRVAKDNTSYNYSSIVLENGYGSYKAVPTDFVKVASFPTNTDTTTGSTILTSYAVRISSSQVADTYVGQVEYVMVHPSMANAPRDDITSIHDMQEVSTSIIEKTLNLTTAVLEDQRDGSTYNVVKYNGMLWMADDLLITGTIPASGSNFTNGPITLTSQNPTDCKKASMICVYKTTLNGEDITYYNLAAATAGTRVESANYTSEILVTTDATEDICPAGWRLPTGTEIDALEQYGWHNSFNEIETVLNLHYGGLYLNGSLTATSNGTWWTSTIDTNHPHLNSSFNYYNGRINKAQALRSYLINIRCVADPSN